MKTQFMSKVFLAAAVLFMMFNTSCKKKSDSSPVTCTSCVTTPDAKAAYDASSKGVYKGTVVGSSGTIKFDIGNNDSTITATMVIDGTTVVLTASVKWASGVAYVSSFTGTLNGSPVSITFSVGVDGTDPTVTAINIPGHPGAVLSVSKETSTNLIMVFEGTYTDVSGGSDKGTFDLFLSKGLKVWKVNYKSSVDSSMGEIPGTFDPSNNTLNFDDGHGTTIKGTLASDKIDGTYNGPATSGTKSGTWTCKRTL